MEDTSKKRKKILKSHDGNKCLTSCNVKGSKYLHPILMTDFESGDNSCAVSSLNTKNTKRIRKIDSWFEKCDPSNNNNSQDVDEIENIMSGFLITAYDLINDVYELKTFDDVIRWLIDNSKKNKLTLARIHNCAWKVYGMKHDEITNLVTSYYYNLSLSDWLPGFIDDVKKEYSFNLIINKNYHPTSLSDIIKNEFYTHNFFTRTLQKYIYSYEDQWHRIDQHFTHIKSFVFSTLVDEINNKFTDNTLIPT